MECGQCVSPDYKALECSRGRIKLIVSCLLCVCLSVGCLGKSAFPKFVCPLSGEKVSCKAQLGNLLIPPQLMVLCLLISVSLCQSVCLSVLSVRIKCNIWEESISEWWSNASPAVDGRAPLVRRKLLSIRSMQQQALKEEAA